MSDGFERSLVVFSGAYASSEISAEFGRLPPAFLPVGGRRLYHSQIELANQLGRRLVITVPDDFEIERWDEDSLHVAGAHVIRSPLSLSLVQALQFVLEILRPQHDIVILHGDTLVDGVNLDQLDCIYTHATREYYPWADVCTDTTGSYLKPCYGDGMSRRTVACGLFAFADGSLLRSAARGKTDFIDCINAYGKIRPLRFEPVEEWYDFGHLPLLFQSKQKLLQGRSFNRIDAGHNSIRKSSLQMSKIEAEAQWYEKIPKSMRVYVPQYLGSGDDGERAYYSLEYLHLPTLAELYVYGRLPVYVWRKILSSCGVFLENCRAIRPQSGDIERQPNFPSHFYDEMLVDKPRQRLQKFLASKGWGENQSFHLNGFPTPEIGAVLTDFISAIEPTTSEHICLWHGDYFFGNMFFDFRSGRVRVVDPRGKTESMATIFGDYRYDFAKLAHSAYGRYDLLLSGYADFKAQDELSFDLDFSTTPQCDVIEAEFSSLTVAGRPVLNAEIRSMVGLLFLSMLPLHSESPERQLMFFANALRIHHDLKMSNEE